MSTYRKKFDFWPTSSKVATTEPEPAKSADNSSSAELPSTEPTPLILPDEGTPDGSSEDSPEYHPTSVPTPQTQVKTTRTNYPKDKHVHSPSPSKRNSGAKYANSKRKKPAQAILISCITHA